MADVENENLGPWQDADLEATTTIHAGLGADAGIPEDIRFRSNVVKLVRRRLALEPESADLELPAIFLLRPSPPDEIRPRQPKRVPMLDNGRHELNGKGMVCWRRPRIRSLCTVRDRRRRPFIQIRNR